MYAEEEHWPDFTFRCRENVSRELEVYAAIENYRFRWNFDNSTFSNIQWTLEKKNTFFTLFFAEHRDWQIELQ